MAKQYRDNLGKRSEAALDGTISVEGAIEEVEAERDSVEVLVTIPRNGHEEAKEEDKKEAKNRVESIVGLLALCFGEQILGKPTFAEYYFGDATGEHGDIHVPVKHLVEVSIGRNIASSFEKPLLKLYDPILGSSTGTALRWYAAGLNNDSPIDTYIAYFVGLEALASGHFASIEPKPIRQEYAQLAEYFAKAQPPISHSLRQTVLSRIADFPLSTKFEKYWISRVGHETRESREFSKFNRLRSELLHGRVQSVTSREVNSVKTLLEKSLVKELGLDDVLTAHQSGPKLLEFVLSYAVVPSNEG